MALTLKLISQALVFISLMTTIRIQRILSLSRNTTCENSENENRTALVDIPESVCDTADCLEYAKELQDGMNASADPCENFYNFMCGRWSQHNPAPPNEILWTISRKALWDIYEEFRVMLEEPENPDDELPVIMAKAWYRSCMDEEALNATGLEPIAAVLDANGGWPMTLDNWEEPTDENSWRQILNTYHRMYAINGLYNIRFTPDQKTSSKVVIRVDLQIPYPLYDSLHSDETANAVDIYLITISEMARLFMKTDASITEEQLTKDTIGLFVFNYKLQEIAYMSQEEQYTENVEVMTISELQNWYDSANQTEKSKIDWLDAIKNVFVNEPVDIDENTMVEVQRKSVLHKLRNLLNMSPVRTIVNYIHWSYVVKYMKYTNVEMQKLYFKAKSSRYPLLRENPRWRTCIDDMKLKDALAYMYVQRYKSEEERVKVEEILDEIVDYVKVAVKKSNSITNEAKELIERKLNNINKLIGYPSWYDDKDTVTNRFEKLSVGSDYYTNVLNYNRYEMSIAASSYGKDFDKHAWPHYPFIVNSFYYPEANLILIPLAMYQGIKLTSSLPDSVKYARVGTIIGHELTHSFILQGLDYDEHGNKISTPISLLKSQCQEKIDCFVRHYGQYVLFNNASISSLDNNKLMKSEFIADSLGLQVSYEVYRNFRERTNGKVRRMKGFEEYTDEQLFFMAFGTWCEGDNFVGLRYLFSGIGDHASWKHRVVGAVSNMQSFATAFNCPLNSKMNPDHKCTLL